MASDQMRNLKVHPGACNVVKDIGGRIMTTGGSPGGHKVYHGSAPAAPVIYPDEEFDFPVEEDYEDVDRVDEPDEDDMIPVWPAGIVVPAFSCVDLISKVEDAMVQPLKEMAERLIAEANAEATSSIILPTTKSELEYLRQTIATLPDGLKAVIYRDLYNEGLRVNDVVSTDKKVGAAEKYIKEFES